MAAEILSVFYNLALTAVLALACGCVCCQYHHYKSPVFIALGTMFGAYLFDNSIVFCTEIVPEFAEFYDKMFLQTPSIKTVYFIVLVSSLLFALHCVIPEFSIRHIGVVIFAYTAVLICAPMISPHDWMVFIYYCSTQLLVILISIWGLVKLRSTQSSFDRRMVKRILLYFLIMSILVLAEDSLVIFFIDRFSGPRMKINNRNFSENLLYLGITLPMFRHTWNLLKQTARKEGETAAVTAPPEPEGDADDAFAFGARYNLTDREQQILYHLLQEKSQQEISEELIIALGTVKTHIHNIYQKTGSTSRGQVIQKFREFQTAETAAKQPESVR